MALGDSYVPVNTNEQIRTKVYDNTYYSRIRIKNKDHLVVSFSFSRGLLKLELSEEKEDFKTEPVTFITISPTKARLLIARMEEFYKKIEKGEHIDPNEGFGINSGVRESVKYIAFKVTGNRTDVPEHSFVLGKVDQNGVVEDQYEFVFNTDYDYSLHWNNVDKMDVDKIYDQFMGFNTILGVLKEFVITSGGATGASTWDIGRYETHRFNTRFDAIYDKLGIERRQAPRAGGDNYFTRQPTGSLVPMSQVRNGGKSENKTYDEIMDEIS